MSMSKIRTLATLAFAFMLGTAATLMTSGCQQSSTGVDNLPVSDQNVQKEDPISINEAQAATKNNTTKNNTTKSDTTTSAPATGTDAAKAAANSAPARP